MRVREAAEVLGCNASTIRNMLRSGRLKGRQIPSHNNQCGYEWDVTAAEVNKMKLKPHGSRGRRKS